MQGHFAGLMPALSLSPRGRILFLLRLLADYVPGVGFVTSKWMVAGAMGLKGDAGVRKRSVCWGDATGWEPSGRLISVCIYHQDTYTSILTLSIFWACRIKAFELVAMKMNYGVINSMSVVITCVYIVLPCGECEVAYS